jgi:hypothetical protein
MALSPVPLAVASQIPPWPSEATGAEALPA